MNDPQTNQGNSDLTSQVEALHRQNFILMLALIVVSGALATYLCYQSRLMGKSVEGIKPQATQVIQTYNQINASLNQASLSNFVSQITAYAITHPDFGQQVLKKYGWNPPPPPAPKK